MAQILQKSRGGGLIRHKDTHTSSTMKMRICGQVYGYAVTHQTGVSLGWRVSIDPTHHSQCGGYKTLDTDPGFTKFQWKVLCRRKNLSYC